MAPRISRRSCSTPSWVEPRPRHRQEWRALGPSAKAPNTGRPLQAPWVAVMNQQTEIARKLAAELALPPAQRSRAGMGPGPRTTTPGDKRATRRLRGTADGRAGGTSVSHFRIRRAQASTTTP